MNQTDFCAKNETKTFLFDCFFFDRIQNKYLQNFPNLIVNDYLLSSLSHRCLKLFKRKQTVSVPKLTNTFLTIA